MAKALMLFLLATVFIACAEEILIASENPDTQNNEQSDFQKATFSLVASPENPKLYSLAISDDDERSISGSFSSDQLQILRAIMAEAEKFAFAGEPAGTREAVTTRFADKHEPAFIVDVQKNGNESLLFLTLKTEIGRMTWEAGKFTRATRREEGFFFDLLTRLESILPKLPSRAPN